MNEIYFSKTNGKCNQKTGFASNCKECNGSSFGINSINSFKEIFHVNDGFKICSKCMLELPNNDDYFYQKSNREYGHTICKKCVSKMTGRELTGQRHLNVSKSHLLQKDEKFCTRCGSIFKKDDINRNGLIFLCDECYKNRNKYNSQKRRNIKNNLLADLTTNEWVDTLLYFGNKCAYCGITENECLKMYHKSLAQEHVVALSKGGGFTKNNIVPACLACNSSKGNMSLEKFFEKSNKFTQQMYDKIVDFIKKNSSKIA